MWYFLLDKREGGRKRMHVKYNTKGTCAVRIEFDVEDGVVKNIAFLGWL